MLFWAWGLPMARVCLGFKSKGVEFKMQDLGFGIETDSAFRVLGLGTVVGPHGAAGCFREPLAALGLV